MRENEFEWNHFCRLGEMMGDGLHLERDGKWISKEYKRLAKILLKPTEEEKELYKKARQEKDKNIDNQIIEKLKVDKCPECEGTFKQLRSGSKVVVCNGCSRRYKYKTKR